MYVEKQKREEKKNRTTGNNRDNTNNGWRAEKACIAYERKQACRATSIHATRLDSRESV